MFCLNYSEQGLMCTLYKQVLENEYETWQNMRHDPAGMQKEHFARCLFGFGIPITSCWYGVLIAMKLKFSSYVPQFWQLFSFCVPSGLATLENKEQPRNVCTSFRLSLHHKWAYLSIGLCLQANRISIMYWIQLINLQVK